MPAPLIYSRSQPPCRLAWPQRLAAIAIALAGLVPLVIASTVNPNPTGIGTHTRIGLNNCTLIDRTGIPCFSCGMTTSFAHFVRLNLPASLYVQPMGTTVALAATFAFWAGLYIAVTGRPAHRLLRLIPTRYYLTLLFTWGTLAWIWKIAIHLTGRDGWP
jgi:Protein of unknown function (DUF2752)